ncbi:DNA helicase MCM9-like [Achroia grisella]|uniref:DNA helicase MCM9-like n=1 Tax=Achroia grisella TaxID=688607 RepID=UPI0027D20EAB|nr:DNA helicase MCM9-like [Achroia grisella]
MIFDYLNKFHFDDCVNILSEKDTLGYYSIKIDFLKLFETYPDVGDKVLCSPIESLSACRQDIIKAQQNVLDGEECKTIIAKLNHSSLKRNVHARFFGLPVCPELHRTFFPKSVDLGCFLKVTGTVVRVTQSKMLEYQRKYICMKCKFENNVAAEFEYRYILKSPLKCGNSDSGCKCATFTQVHLVSREHCKDYQEIKIQEQVNKLNVGTIPGSMWVVLEDDLVDCCKPGDDVNICGIVRRRWRPTVQTKKAEVELVLQANFIEVCNSRRSEVVATAPDIKECFNEFWSKYEACPLKGRDQILASVCPQVYGLHLVKLAVLLTVITGSNHVIECAEEKKISQDEKHSTRVRGQCHLLLVGDPGTGKSQLLRTSAELMARSVFTSGAGSTRAGLTCAALREDGEWQLEAGALVLSDGGVCCIDEISQLREHDRTAIHEAMEQQTISIAKAGIVCKLNTRCAVIAACNPKGHYQTDQPLSANVSLGTPLLSRFDLIFILLDSKNKSWDKLVSSYILFGGSSALDKKRWNIEKLQMYISLVGPKYAEMTKSANIILQSYYMLQRKSEYRDPSRTTVRMLDSLVRLSQAHCRLMFRSTILPMDAITAVSLVDLSMQDCTLNDTVDALHTTIPKYSDYEYLCIAKKLLTRLNLLDIWRNELLYYGNLLQVDHKTLEQDITNGNCQLFARYDDVTDETIPISASLVTSSYFNKDNRKQVSENNDRENECNNFQNRDCNEKLAATLKKHATMNKIEKKPPIVQKKKRKRKEVTLNVSLKNNKSKRIKSSKLFSESENISDSEKEDTSILLNAVPSVNDVFKDLEIDLKFEVNDCEETDDNIISCKNQSKKLMYEKDNGNIEINENNENNSESERVDDSINNKSRLKENIDSENLPKLNKFDKQTSAESNINKASSISNKLKQFQFTEKHDINKYYKENTEPKVKVEKIDESISNLSSGQKILNSQISMFESSDCDVDLDI